MGTWRLFILWVWSGYKTDVKKNPNGSLGGGIAACKLGVVGRGGNGLEGETPALATSKQRATPFRQAPACCPGDPCFAPLC